MKGGSIISGKSKMAGHVNGVAKLSLQKNPCRQSIQNWDAAWVLVTIHSIFEIQLLRIAKFFSNKTIILGGGSQKMESAVTECFEPKLGSAVLNQLVLRPNWRIISGCCPQRWFEDEWCQFWVGMEFDYRFCAEPFWRKFQIRSSRSQSTTKYWCGVTVVRCEVDAIQSNGPQSI